MVQSCKYFFVKNPILVADGFAYYRVDGKWTAFVYKGNDRTKFSSVSSKFWITKEFSNYVLESSPNMISSILPKFYRVNVKELGLSHQNISFDDFLFLTSNVENIFLGLTVVKNEDGSTVPLEQLIKLLPRVKNIEV
uniref:Uncharacterized protein n=1 Tax=Panagrolaimus sp. ES5 TaxID=591445 RepID=A0AC34FJ32_9BILA